MFALLPFNLFIEERWFKFHVCRACEKTYTNGSLRRKYPSLLLEVSAEWNSFGVFHNTLLKVLLFLDTNEADETLFRGKWYSTPWLPECIIPYLHNKLRYGTINFLGNERHIGFALDFVQYLKRNNLSAIFSIQSFFLAQRFKEDFSKNWGLWHFHH